ncbi:MAG: hypothetical protein ACRDJ3_10055 [Solirubrobacteraceae bacterium]
MSTPNAHTPASTARRSLLALALCMGVAASVGATPARAHPSATISPILRLSPHGSGALDLNLRFSDEESEEGVPSPVRHTLLRFPVGLNVEIPLLRSCNAARLRAHGPSACPPQSHIGGGHALAEVHAGSQTITEHITLWVFLGPLDNLSPTFLILGRGYTPFAERVVLSGSVISDTLPFGEDLALSIPAIHTLPLEPDASIVSMSLLVGSTSPHASHAATVVVPHRCPAGGFPFAATFTYADGFTGQAFATAHCPR